MESRATYFIGIGGIGMSALAQWYAHQGWNVSGSDAAESIVTSDLLSRGTSVSLGKDIDGTRITKDFEFVVYSTAVPEDHPERAKARELGIVEQSYPEALGELTRRYKTLAVCGTHGKSTTTAMLALILVRAGLDPTVIVGTKLKEFGGNNFRAGSSEWLVIEADEYKAAFLHHTPHAILCLNVDSDHLDFYRDFDEIKETFQKFFKRVSFGGVLVLNGDDVFLAGIPEKKGVGRLYFTIPSERADRLRPLLHIPGWHNLSNACAADALAEWLGIGEDARDAALGSFTGTWRRFEHKGEFKGARVYDDYAHHPAEIKATLAAAREIAGRGRLICVFQPHHTSRLIALFDDFAPAFQDADVVMVVETYKVEGREDELEDETKNARALATLIGQAKEAHYVNNRDEALTLLDNVVSPDDLIMVMGAGDITLLADRLVHHE